MEVKLKIRRDKFEQIFSIEDWFNFGEMNNIELYNKMLNFVVDDDGNEVSVEDARKLFKKVPKAQWSEYIAKFSQAIRDHYVSPTNGGS